MIKNKIYLIGLIALFISMSIGAAQTTLDKGRADNYVTGYGKTKGASHEDAT